ncbi:hypothetical protein F4819DRAFT_467203 [Hypoxylon fuscum]|nr:hypothetical protein F4819DRAFT_467203 [Hypoxylon fuscum]
MPFHRSSNNVRRGSGHACRRGSSRRGSINTNRRGSSDIGRRAPSDSGRRTSPQRTIQVKKRDMKVIRALFHCPSDEQCPAQTEWKDFRHTMRRLGFTHDRRGGSTWVFELPNIGGVVLVHSPHPHNTFVLATMRSIGQIMTHFYGWKRDTFTEE